jgi:hypothetical protein
VDGGPEHRLDQGTPAALLYGPHDYTVTVTTSGLTRKSPRPTGRRSTAHAPAGEPAEPNTASAPRLPQPERSQHRPDPDHLHRERTGAEHDRSEGWSGLGDGGADRGHDETPPASGHGVNLSCKSQPGPSSLGGGPAAKWSRSESTSVCSIAAPSTSTWDAELGTGQRWLAGNPPKLVYQWCGVCPVLAVVGPVAVGAVDAGADAVGAVDAGVGGLKPPD